MNGHPWDMPRRLGTGWGEAPDSFLLRVPADAANLAFARAVVAAFAARLPFTVEEIEDLKLAVSEIVANCIVHAYPAGQPGPVWVAARVVEGALEVMVEDRGRGIADVDKAREAGYSTVGGEHLGIGFSVAETYVDELSVESAPGEGTCVRMLKRPASQAAGPLAR